MAEYSKRPLWQWILIYLVVGVAVYGLIYYFVFSKRGGINYGGSSQPTIGTQQNAPAY